MRVISNTQRGKKIRDLIPNLGKDLAADSMGVVDRFWVVMIEAEDSETIVPSYHWFGVVTSSTKVLNF
jgi:hypothetical protein